MSKAIINNTQGGNYFVPQLSDFKTPEKYKSVFVDFAMLKRYTFLQIVAIN